MVNLLTKLETLIKKKRPDLFRHLSPPLFDTELNQALGDYASKLPKSLKSIWMWHNGQSPDYYGDFHSKTNEMLMSVEDSLEVKKMLDDYTISGDISKTNWNLDWFPFMENGGGNYMCISLNDGSIYYFDKGEVSTGHRFNSFEDWFSDLLNGYEAL